MPNSAPTQSFRHRENQDGSWDSICMRCYLTAAHSYGEQPLVSVESTHRCDEASWLYIETTGRRTNSSRTCPPSAMPRFARAERIQFGEARLRAGWPAGLRESITA